MTTTQQRPTEALDLINRDLRALLIKDVRKDWPDLTDERGERGVNQMVAFLAAGTVTDSPLTPSLRVDLFWHRFLQRTVPYVAFSRSLGVDYIHHVPDDEVGADPEEGRAAMATTTAAIKAAGFEVDPEFWPGMGAADCSQCHAGCTDSPVNK